MRIVHLDLHCHSFFSADGVSDPVDIVRHAKAKGLHGFAITDHNTCEAVDYMIEHGLMRADGLPVDDFLILPGVEVTTAEGHLLCLGATLPNLKGHPAAEVVDLIHQAGGLAVPPHPYDLFRAGIRQAVLDTLPIDALEVFNAATTFKRYNRRAFDYAHKRGLPMTAASDAHHADAVGTAFSLVAVEEFTVSGVLDGIRRGAELNERYLTPSASFRKTWANVLRLRRPKRLKTASDGAEG